MRVERAAKCVDVAIVGAGPVGLTLSNLLGKYGVSNRVFEASSRPSVHPQVRVGLLFLHFLFNRLRLTPLLLPARYRAFRC